MSIKIDTTRTARPMLPAHRRMLDVMALRQEKLDLLDKLRGRTLSTWRGREEAEKALAKLIDRKLLVPADFLEILYWMLKPAEADDEEDFIATKAGLFDPDPLQSVVDELEAKLTERRDELTADDLAFIMRTPRLCSLNLRPLVAGSLVAPKDILSILLRSLDRKILLSARQNLLARRLATPVEILTILLGHSADQVREEASSEIIGGEYVPEDFPLILKKYRLESLRAWAARHPAASKSTLLALLENSGIETAREAQKSLRSRHLADDDEILAAAKMNPDPEIASKIIRDWPHDRPFLPDRSGLVFPLSLAGCQSDALSGVNSYRGLESALCQIRDVTLTEMKYGYVYDHAAGYSMLSSSRIERDLVLLAHQQPHFGNGAIPSPQALLCGMRAQAALKSIGDDPSPNYHALAYLYYSLRFGQATLGSEDNEKTIIASLRGLKARQVCEPRVLVLGFSSIYSLENIGALLFLSGFKTAAITAIDISPRPLARAKNYFGDKIFGFPVRYLQTDALDLQLPADSFNLVATHLFMTHIANEQKPRVLSEVKRVLAPGGEFTDEEIVVVPGTDLDKYRWFYATLGDNYQGDVREKSRARELMVQFGSYHSIFLPYQGEQALEADLRQSELAGGVVGRNSRLLYQTGEGRVYADCCQIRGSKI